MKTNTCLIPLTQGKFAIVDACDYDFLMQWKWHILKLKTSYGYRCYADHADRNGLNNTRDNIRPSSIGQNRRNQTKRSGASSRHKGVSWSKTEQKWVAQICFNYKCMRLGSFKNEDDASEAYRIAAIKYHGDFACVT